LGAQIVEEGKAIVLFFEGYDLGAYQLLCCEWSV